MSKFTSFVLAALVLTYAHPAWAAYRVYVLKIVNYDARGRVASKQTVTSTLDIWQYEHYYGGHRWMDLKLVDTWYCPGDTSRRKFCAKPRVGTRTPSSRTPGGRAWLPYNLQPVIP